MYRENKRVCQPMEGMMGRKTQYMGMFLAELVSGMGSWIPQLILALPRSGALGRSGDEEGILDATPNSVSA